MSVNTEDTQVSLSENNFTAGTLNGVLNAVNSVAAENAKVLYQVSAGEVAAEESAMA